MFVRPCSARVPLEVPSLVLATVWAPFGLFWIQFWLRFGIAGTRAGIEYTRGKARHWIWTFPAVEAYFSASTLYFPLLLHHCFAHWFYSIFDICELTFDICYDVFLLSSWSHLHLATPSKTMTLTLLLACSGTSGKHDLPCSYCSVYIYIYIYIHDLVWVINDWVIDFVVTADFSVCGSRVVASLGSNKCTP